MLSKHSKISVKVENTPTIMFAAENLQKYLTKILGCSVVIDANEFDYQFILQIDTANPQLKHDGFEVRVGEKETRISSKVGRGVLYGVYDFLEKYFGVKFLAPDCEIIPTCQEIQLPLEAYVSNPAFALRGAFNGANRWVGDYYSKSRNHNAFEVIEEKYGGDCGWERVNGLKWATGHNSLCYVEEDIYGQDHPELFAHNRGKVTDICFTSGVTDEGTKEDKEITCVNIVSRYIKTRIAEDANVKYFMVGQQDSWGGFENECVCERCQKARAKYKSSGILVRFLNLVADDVNAYVKEHCPDREVYIVGFSYAQTFDAPVRTENGISQPIDSTVVCRDNVSMWLCQSGRIDWNGNKLYAFSDEKHNPAMAENYKSWLKLCKKVMLWEYSVNYHDTFWYFPALKMTQESIQTLAKADCEYYFALFNYQDVNEWQSLMKGYVASKQIWDPTLDYKPLLQEFLDGYYGAGSPFVGQMIELFEKHFQTLANTHKDFFIAGSKNDDFLMNGNYYPKELLDEADALLDKAEAAIEKAGCDVETYVTRIGCVRLTPMRMRLYNYFMYHKDKESIFAYFAKFKELADKSNITFISEGGSITELEWQMKILKELFAHPSGSWDIYRYIYDGIVANFQLPKRK